MFNLNEEIGGRISLLRKSQGLTQEKLAEKLNCSVKHISHVERGVASLSLDLLVEVCALLDCSLDYLVKGTASPPESRIPLFITQILNSTDEDMAEERELLLSYLNMYRKLRE